MQACLSRSPSRTARPLARTLLCCALALASAAARAEAAEPVEPGLPGVAQSQRTRSLFVATVVSFVAQGVGSSLSTVVGGSITRWFANRPKAVQAKAVAPKPQAAPASARPGAAAAPASLHAGMAYEVHVVGAGGLDRAVDPARHAFRTGERFRIFYRPTLPGRVKVFNIDPQGGESGIDSAAIAAGQLVALGPYQFVGGAGKETIKLVLEPCSTAQLSAATRAIVKAGAPAANPARQIAECNPAGPGTAVSTPRRIAKVTVDGATAFALDPLSREELSSGRIGAREVRIALTHR